MLPESTKTRVRQLIAAMPGLKSREIANCLGIDKRELNRFCVHPEHESLDGYRHRAAGLLSSLQGDAFSLAGERRRVDPHWNRGLSFARIGLHWLQQSVITAGRALPAWLPIPLQALEPWFSRVELPPPLPCTPTTAVAGPSRL